VSRKTMSAERSFADLRKDTAYEAANPSIDRGWTAA
jgi:hypothetical protein